jgi:uncharacterized repeat protein (TIGR02543 family)
MNKKKNRFKNVFWIFVTVVSLLLLSACTNQNEYTIQFDSNGGSEIEDITFNINDPITDLPEPTKEGHVFSGWYTDEAFSEVFDLENMSDKEIILYAKWSEDNLVTITYNAKGGLSDQMIEVKDDETPTVYIPTKEGYLFSGWYIDETYDEAYIFDEPLTEDTTLYARWEERSTTILSIVYSDEIIYEFNITDGKLPVLSPTVPKSYASKTDKYYKDAEMRRKIDSSFTFNSSTTIYARLSDAYYLYYDLIEVAQPDLYISPSEVLVDGKLYEYSGLMNDKATLEQVHVYRKPTSFYEFPQNFEIKNIQYIDDYILFESNDGKQYLKSMRDKFRPDSLLDLSERYELNDGEKIEQKINVLQGSIIVTSEGRIIYDGSSFINQSLLRYNLVDITDEISLEDNETLLPEIIMMDEGYSFKTSTGRVFALTDALLNYNMFKDIDNTKVFTECNMLLNDQDEIITLTINQDELFYLTAKGYVYYQALNSTDIMNYQLPLQDGEEVVDFFGNIVFTSHHRYFEMESYDYYQDVTKTKYNDIIIKSSIKNAYLGIMLIETTEDEIYYYSNVEMSINIGAALNNVTESFLEFDLTLQDVIFYDEPIMVKDGHIYNFGENFSIHEMKYGFISTKIDGPYDEGDQVIIDTFESEMYNVKGYESVSYELDTNQISMPAQDLFMRLSFEFEQKEVLLLQVDGSNFYIDYMPGDEITYEDIKHLIPDSKEIDFIINFRTQTKVELPIKTSSVEDTLYQIYVYTKPKEEALSVDFHVFSEDRYFGTLSFYASINDLTKSYANEIDSYGTYYGFAVEGIYIDEEMTILYDQDSIITEDTEFYVQLKSRTTQILTIHTDDDTYYELFGEMFYLSQENITEVFDMNYQKLESVAIKGIYLDQEKTIPLESGYMLYESTEIWVDAELNYEIRLYEVDAFNKITRFSFVDYNGLSVSDLLDRMIRDLYKIDRLFLDEALTIELFEGDELPYLIDQLFYTTSYISGIETTIHVYDQDEQFIETLIKESPMSTVKNFVTAYGYSQIELFMDSDFEKPYIYNSAQGETLYAKAVLDYVTIEVINPVTSESYSIKHPINQIFNRDALTAYLQHIDAGYLNLVYYEDEDLTKPIQLNQISQDMKIYIADSYNFTNELVTLHASGDIAFVKEFYLPEFYTIRLRSLTTFIENELELSTDDVDIMMFSDPELTIPISEYVIGESNQIYISITLTPQHRVLLRDADSHEIIWNVTYDSGITLNLIDAFSNAYNSTFPFVFHNYHVNEYYLDEALTMPVETIEVTEDTTIYVKVVPATQHTITYQFEGIELDDLVLTLTEKENMNNRLEVYRYVLSHIDTHIKAEILYIFTGVYPKGFYPSEDTTVKVEVLQTQFYEVEFVYELDGESVHDIMFFEEGSNIDDSLFFGVLFENPNDYDAYFYEDEAMTNGTLTVVIDRDMTLYVKVVRKY